MAERHIELLALVSVWLIVISLAALFGAVVGFIVLLGFLGAAIGRKAFD